VCQAEHDDSSTIAKRRLTTALSPSQRRATCSDRCVAFRQPTWQRMSSIVMSFLGEVGGGRLALPPFSS
jgi:hypothetical protein